MKKPASQSSLKKRRSGIAAALRYFKPKIVKPKKGRKAYRRKPKHVEVE